MNRILRIVNWGVALALVGVAALVYWYAYRPLAALSGTVSLGVAKAAKIVRDAEGLPHIEAASAEDAAYLQGYVHAQDRLWQMDALRRLAAGELSEILGAAGLESDQESRRMRMRRLAEFHAASVKAEDRVLLSAYARGVNRYLETHRGKLPVEFKLLDYDPKPWSVVDSLLVGLQMFRNLSQGWKDELVKQTLLAKGDKEKVNFLLPMATGHEAQLGSNAWVISGKHTASGKPLLANDTHLDWAFPGPWYAVHLKAPDLDVEGFSFPGLPMVIIGHNRNIAWGITNLHFDVQDLYAERFDPRSGRYVFQGKAEQAQLEREVIRVRGRQPVELQIWVTRHGPIFQSAGNAHLALRWMAAEAGGFGYPFPRINRARNWEEFRAAVALHTGPGSNYVYADTAGNIGYQAAGHMPIRRNHRGDVPVDGAAGESEWDGVVPFEALPSVYNPPSGMLITANQNPFPAKYEYAVNGNFTPHYRVNQIDARLRKKTGWKPGEMLSIQTDVYSAFSHRLAKDVYRAWEKRAQGNPVLRDAAVALKDWNGQMQAGLTAPVVVTLVFQHLRRAIGDRASPGQGAAYEQQMAPAVIEKLLDTRPKEWFADFDQLLVKCFSDAIAEGKQQLGENVSKWDYGKYTGFTLQHPVISRVPYLGGWFRIGPVPMSGSTTTVKQTTRRMGPAMRFVADLSNWEQSLYSVTIGQSGQVLSPHFRDQWDAYYAGRAFPLQFGSVAAKDTIEVKPE
ncbi:MAG: penicillin acylase family protein [Acidobacteria bacterium]|nr:penicillin acylase family protein [Acidobacteriota bacterium]